MRAGRTLSVDFQGWHVWENTQGRCLCSDPEDHSLLDFASVDEAINWHYLLGRRELARAIHAAKSNGSPHINLASTRAK